MHIICWRDYVVYLTGPGAYYAAGISLPLVVWFILTHLKELRGPTKIGKREKQDAYKGLA
jgi:hypothetical protein